MKDHNKVFETLKQELGSNIRVETTVEHDSSVFILPFKDSFGDNLLIRLRQEEGNYVIDDGGLIDRNLFIIRETIGGIRSKNLISALMKTFNANINQDGITELISETEEIIPNILHFTKLLITADTMLVETKKQDTEEEKPQRQSLGPRATQKIKKPLAPLIKAGAIKQRFEIEGQTVPDWVVDLAYEPRAKRITLPSEMVVIITVDLAVADPISKATHAFSRAIDIKSIHENYDIQIAYDTHGRNSSCENAARFLSQHKLDNNAYATVDLNVSNSFSDFMRKISHETGMTLQL